MFGFEAPVLPTAEVPELAPKPEYFCEVGELEAVDVLEKPHIPWAKGA